MLTDDITSFASRADRGSIELRGQCPRDIVDVLDAVSTARGLDRSELVNEVLGKWAAETVHVATVVMRVARGNPSRTDAAGRTPE